MNNVGHKILLVLLLMTSLWLVASKLKGSWSNPPRSAQSYFTERLGLAGEFSGPLPGGLELGLKSLALGLEQDPARLAILRGESPPEELEEALSPAFRLWARHIKAPHLGLEKELVQRGFDGLMRLIVCFVASAVVFLTVIVTFIFMTRPPDEDDQSFPSLKWGKVLTVFCCWIVLNELALLLIRNTLVGQTSRFNLILAGQFAYYGIGAVLLSLSWKWGTWKPWKTLDGRLVGQAFCLLLLIMPTVEIVVHKLTGVDPNLQLSLLPYFRGLSTGQGSALALLAIFVGPIFEELMFRGWILGGLKSQFGAGKALVLSSFLFAVAHGSLWAIPGAFVFALLAGALALRTESIASSILLHVVWNATTLCWLFAAL